MEIEKTYTKQNLIETYNISLSKIDKDLKSGRLPHIKVGARAVRFTPENIESYVDIR
jgi:predicted DNA-binding transcriptional regulator AlpA